MIQRILPIALLSAAMITSTGCGNSGGFKQIHGISYKIVKDVPGKNAKMGDIVEFNIVAKVDTVPGQAMILANSRQQGKPSVTRVDSVRNAGDFQAIFPYMSAGDSAVIEVSCDTILKTVPPTAMGNLPKWLKKGNKIQVTIAVVSVKSMEDYKKEMEGKQAQMQQEMKEKMEQQKPIDEKLLQDYFAKNNIKAQKTESGLYYTIQKPGSGATIAKGQQVTMMYTGKTLDGKVFDSNVDTAVSHNSNPLKFMVGKGQMIPGVDEGAGLLKKGAKATLYLPSSMAYGPQSPSPAIGPNAILIFEVEITDVKDAVPVSDAGAGAPGAPPQGRQ